MRKNILVIGGTRYFGKLLVQRLLAAGHQVTIATRGHAPDPFGERITRIRVDRRNERAMLAAFSGAEYDLVYDQMCYSPLDAAIAVRVFSGKVKRYVVASTIEVYRSLLGVVDSPFAEDDINVLAQPIDTAYPWHDPKRATESYVSGKLQAEAYLYRDGSLPLVTVRIGHVLAGAEDFTGRLAHYVDLARQYGALRYANAAAASSFISAQRISDFLAWTGMQEFTGPVNAACDGGLSAFDIYQRVGMVLEQPVRTLPVTHAVQPGELSPFDYPAPIMMDTARAAALGYRFGHSDDWLDTIIRQHDLAFV
ncbi:NAD-dependent epimerase/dehydratase family protein [Massilia sp. PAMC28688]|uniref:NAD-dependent epimerase/dehydratase family protein n=1 Tax=Massilia sp. PAMC28688 TaxID=2861283 RepID=UPI001C63106E|nr:NAD-dependent epimerase/dehydratase family protein [Massilia sp. PAMC28688]QYF93286.1 NAD-dependent epimerase/dehydratase family protein [Massilia sp. PAMC28688]